MEYIIVNFAYGFGPFLRTTELALSVSEILERKTGREFGIIVPLVYGEKQKQIMKEEFGSIIDKNQNKILLEKNLGKFLNSVFYGEKGYKESLKYYLENNKKIEKLIGLRFKEGLVAEDFNKKNLKIKKRNISLEITRAPRVSFPIEPAYYTSFAYISEILERALEEKEVATDKKLIKKVIPICENIENNHNLHFIAEPATFYYLDNRRKKFVDEITTPPNIALPQTASCSQIKRGLYATITGIPGLERLFKEAKKIGLYVYTNKPELIIDSEKALPGVMGCSNILLHFARSGWGSIWLSQLYGVPFVAPEFDKFDDPEIYFNNICIEKIGLGKIFKGQMLKDLLDFREEYKDNVYRINKYLIGKYGTLDGIKYTAEKIVNHFLNI